MDSTEDVQGPLITLAPPPPCLPLNFGAPLSPPLSPPSATVVPPLEIISPKPKRLIPNLAAYLEDASDEEGAEDDEFIPRTESPEPMAEFQEFQAGPVRPFNLQSAPPYLTEFHGTYVGWMGLVPSTSDPRGTPLLGIQLVRVHRRLLSREVIRLDPHRLFPP